MLPRSNRKAWLGLGVLLLCGLGVAIHVRRSPSPVSCELHLLLPATTRDPDNDRVFGKLTINGKPIPEEQERARNFQVPLKASEEPLTIIYEFWPRLYTHIIRTRTISAGNGTIINIDLRKEDTGQPDRIEAGQAPTPMPVVERMCQLPAIGPQDVVIDIGCGDGRMVRTAVGRFGARKGIGIDIDPAKIQLCKHLAAKEGLQDRIEFRVADALRLQNLDDATVVMLYVGEHLNMKLRPLLKKHLKSGARIVSHDFDMGDWEPDRTERFLETNILGETEEIRIHLWLIP